MNTNIMRMQAELQLEKAKLFLEKVKTLELREYAMSYAEYHGAKVCRRCFPQFVCRCNKEGVEK